MRSTFVHSAYAAAFAAHGSHGGAVAAPVIVAFCVLALAVALMLLVTSVRFAPGDGRGDESGPEGGGGGPGGGGPSDPRPPADDPVWWPEFERQFADFVTSTIRA